MKGIVRFSSKLIKRLIHIRNTDTTRRNIRFQPSTDGRRHIPTASPQIYILSYRSHERNTYIARVLTEQCMISQYSYVE